MPSSAGPPAAVVTGAASGIGAAVVRAVVTDVAEAEALGEALDRAEADIGPLEAAVAAAGTLRTGPVITLSDKDWQDTFAINSTGVFTSAAR
jgi:2,3-dihydro-2,3-dihydroxybenzoate dehydrogenase